MQEHDARGSLVNGGARGLMFEQRVVEAVTRSSEPLPWPDSWFDLLPTLLTAWLMDEQKLLAEGIDHLRTIRELTLVANEYGFRTPDLANRIDEIDRQLAGYAREAVLTRLVLETHEVALTRPPDELKRLEEIWRDYLRDSRTPGTGP